MTERRGVRSWTVGEEHALTVLAPLGANQIAELLGRTPRAVRHKASRMGVSVKKDRETFGTVLAQSVIDYVRRRDPEMLCPWCGERLVSIKSTGLCGVCHYQKLKEAHDRAYAELAATKAAKRAYDTSKQQLSRLRKEMGVKAPSRRG